MLFVLLRERSFSLQSVAAQICRSAIALRICVVVACLASCQFAAGQVTRNYSVEIEPENEGIELLQADPYDLVRFKPSAGGGWVKVVPFSFPGRVVPQQKSGTLAMNVLGLPGKTYEAKWEEIQSIELWEERLVNEATKRMEKGDFSGAFPFISILCRDNPGVAKFENLKYDYLLKNALADYRGGDHRRTLAILEELRRIAPNYQTASVLSAIGKVTDLIMTSMMDEGKLEQAQLLLARLKEDYSPSQVSSITTWNDKFLAMAKEKQDSAKAAFAAQQWREAKQLAIESLNLYPSIQGGVELVREVDAAYPIVKVGVLQTATVLDPTRIDNWPARRTGRLVYRSLFEMQSAGSEGGEYQFLFGDFVQTPDRMELQLKLRPDKLNGTLSQVDSFVLGDRLTAMALRDSSSYNPAWASNLRSLAVPDPLGVGIFLRRPHVLPQSLLQVKVDGSWGGYEEGTPTGAYALSMDKPYPGELRFVLTNFAGENDTRPREIVEVQQDDASDAVAALVKGDLDVMDHLFPADAQRLSEQSNIRVGRYPLPSVHLLIPVSEHPYLADPDFRRGLVYGVDRNDVLRGELLGNKDIEGCRVISGPFPAGVNRDDPLGYAYDEGIEPLSYQPRVAALLKAITEQRLKAKAEKDKETPPPFTPLRLGYPQDDLTRIAAQAIAQQWNMVGITTELVELPIGLSMPTDDSCDLVYSIVALWEPVTDARRVFGPDGLAKSTNQLVGLGLRRLEQARNWREVRDRLRELHGIVHSQLPVIPLWQLVDSYAYNTRLKGMGANIVTLYQGVDRWSVNK